MIGISVVVTNGEVSPDVIPISPILPLPSRQQSTTGTSTRLRLGESACRSTIF